MRPEDVEVTPWPPRHTGGMSTGDLQRGVRVCHKPTGAAVECSHHRSQFKNREAALVVLELLVDDGVGALAIKLLETIHEQKRQ